MAGFPSEASDLTTPIPGDATDPVERLLAEGPLGMSAAARRLGTFRGGRPTHASTPARWVTDGVRLADGSILRLEAVRLNGRLVTSWPSVLRFIRAQQGQVYPATPAAEVRTVGRPGVRTLSARRLASGAAAKRLENAGI